MFYYIYVGEIHLTYERRKALWLTSTTIYVCIYTSTSIESISSMELQSRALSDEQNQLANVANVFGNSFASLENECGSSSSFYTTLLHTMSKKRKCFKEEM